MIENPAGLMQVWLHAACHVGLIEYAVDSKRVAPGSLCRIFTGVQVGLEIGRQSRPKEPVRGFRLRVAGRLAGCGRLVRQQVHGDGGYGFGEMCKLRGRPGAEPAGG